jgi:ABC-type bacteriocin/lantibiotic exporter with double-glycine peptidase domain
LSFALSKVGIDVAQEKIAKDTGVDKNGVDPDPLAKAARSYGAQAEMMSGENADKTLKELSGHVKMGHSVLVDYLVSGEKDGGHYVCFLGMNGNHVRIFDPSEGGGKREMDRTYFVQNWRDRTEGGKVMKNWAMIVSVNGDTNE